jgi:adenylate cyclase
MRYIESHLRLGSGIILALYVVQHLINHAFGIVSIEAAEAYRETIGAVFQSLPGLVLLYGSLLIHATIALRSIYRRSSLRLSLWQWLQLLLGLSILPLVVGHAVANRGFDLLGNIDPNYYYVVTSILLKPVFLVKLIFLIAIIWIHMAIGLHYWLRIRKTYPRILPYAYTLVVLIPALAYVGLFSMLQQAPISRWTAAMSNFCADSKRRHG